jgi:hypothetical protein
MMMMLVGGTLATGAALCRIFRGSGQRLGQDGVLMYKHELEML